jgi:Ser/Thr protein kinase RdoA (MazF antagonist)
MTRAARFQETRNILATLYAASGNVGFEFPEPLGVVEDLNLELFGHVSGAVLFSMVQSGGFPVLCRQTGRALARFHNLPSVAPLQLGTDEQISRLAENADAFACILPGEQSRIEDITQEITRRLRGESPSLPALIHGDFHGDNILVAGERLALLDMEDCATGEPAEDVSSQWTQLTWHQHRAGAANTLPAAGCSAFLEGYLENACSAVEKRLPLFAAMHCFLYAHQCLRHPRDPMRFEDAQIMLEVSEAVLNEDSLLCVDVARL